MVIVPLLKIFPPLRDALCVAIVLLLILGDPETTIETAAAA
jgi:hypothetical protein